MEKIKELREKTGAGMADCKKALDESNGDIEKAIEILRKKGIAKAAKRGDREACEGVIKIGTNPENNTGFVVKINSETDFVARNDKFQNFSEKVLNLAKDNKPTSLEDLLNLPMDNGSAKETVDSLSGIIGEKLTISEYAILSGKTVAAYSHMGGKIGVLVSFDNEINNELATDIAMHIAAANPKYLTSEDVPAEEIAKEKEIYKEQLLKEGKPENIIDNILTGKINKYFEEICLANQEYVKDDKKKVSEVLGDVKVEKFVRFSL